MRRSNCLKHAAEGEWMVAQTVMPLAASAATAATTCAATFRPRWQQGAC